MEEDLAVEILDYIKNHEVKSLNELLNVEGVDKQMLKVWAENLKARGE